ncbi:hypothetical protein BKA93DRAFT_813109 [Sparassis latifolia]
MSTLITYYVSDGSSQRARLSLLVSVPRYARPRHSAVSLRSRYSQNPCRMYCILILTLQRSASSQNEQKFSHSCRLCGLVLRSASIFMSSSVPRLTLIMTTIPQVLYDLSCIDPPSLPNSLHSCLLCSRGKMISNRCRCNLSTVSVGIVYSSNLGENGVGRF